MAAVLGFSALTPLAAPKAADISNTLAAGVWSETSELSGDERRYVKMTKLNSTVSTTANLGLPANILGNAIVSAYIDSLVDGITVTQYSYLTSPTGFKLTGGTVSYTDVVSNSTAMGSLVTATTALSTTLPAGGAAAIKLTTGATAATGEQVEIRVQYKLPSKCRWPSNC